MKKPIVLLAISVLVSSMFTTIISAQPVGAAGTGGYPHSNAPCYPRRSEPNNHIGGCANYDWRVPVINSSGKTEWPVWSSRGYGIRNCTDYVAWRLQDLGVSGVYTKGLGNGGSWYDNALAKGLNRGDTPALGAAAVKPPGNPGHVALVTGITNDASGKVGLITVAEYNHLGDGKYGERTGKPSDFGFKYVYFANHMDPTKLASIGSQAVGFTRTTQGDFTGDGLPEAAVYRPSTNQWHIRGGASTTYGQAGDIPVPADYSGDGKADFAVYRPSQGMWYIHNYGAAAYGQTGDIPVPGHYNADNKADIAVFRPSTGEWHRRNIDSFSYGQVGDVPVVADFDGDKN